MKVHIRPYKMDDLEQTTAIWYENQFFVYDDPEEHYEFERLKSFFKNDLLTENEVWVAASKDRILGFLALKHSHISQLYVASDFQRQGIGTLLIDKAKKMSPHKLTLFSFKHLGACAFYEKHGFKAVQANLEDNAQVEYLWKP